MIEHVFQVFLQAGYFPALAGNFGGEFFSTALVIRLFAIQNTMHDYRVVFFLCFQARAWEQGMYYCGLLLLLDQFKRDTYRFR
jgi:hypothetical protein